MPSISQRTWITQFLENVIGFNVMVIIWRSFVRTLFHDPGPDSDAYQVDFGTSAFDTPLNNADNTDLISNSDSDTFGSDFLSEASSHFDSDLLGDSDNDIAFFSEDNSSIDFDLALSSDSDSASGWDDYQVTPRDIFNRDHYDEDNDSDGGFSSMDNLMNLSIIAMACNAFQDLQGTRYINERRNAPKSSHWYHHILPCESDRRFQRFFRMSREAFGFLLRLIQDDPVFYNESTCPQAPVEKQLHVFLYYLGSSSDAGSWMHIGKAFGIGEGTVGDYVTRVMTAILNHEDCIVTWPEPGTQAYKDMMDKHFINYGFPGCAGFLDGCHVSLIRRPYSRKHKSYYTRKNEYAINFTAVVDSDTRILYQHIGHVGSAHDSTIFRDTNLYQHPELFFHHESAYLIGDSAYRLTNYLVKPFTHPQLIEDETGQRRQFNKRLSSARVSVEHAFGIMKGRFPILRRIPNIVNETGGHDRVVNIIRTICVLHNFLLDCEDEWELSSEEEKEALAEELDEVFAAFMDSEWAEQASDLDNQELWNGDETQKELGQQKREFLMEEVLRNKPLRELRWWRELRE
jgi:hypothetical protein